MTSILVAQACGAILMSWVAMEVARWFFNVTNYSFWEDPTLWGNLTLYAGRLLAVGAALYPATAIFLQS